MTKRHCTVSGLCLTVLLVLTLFVSGGHTEGRDFMFVDRATGKTSRFSPADQMRSLNFLLESALSICTINGYCTSLLIDSEQLLNEIQNTIEPLAVDAVIVQAKDGESAESKGLKGYPFAVPSTTVKSVAAQGDEPVFCVGSSGLQEGWMSPEGFLFAKDGYYPWIRDLRETFGIQKSSTHITNGAPYMFQYKRNGKLRVAFLDTPNFNHFCLKIGYRYGGFPPTQMRVLPSTHPLFIVTILFAVVLGFAVIFFIGWIVRGAYRKRRAPQRGKPTA